MAVFIVISILIHIFTILALVVLYQRRSLERLNLPSFKDDVETIHQSMASFVDEIEKENEVLYDKIEAHLQGTKRDLEKKIEDLERNWTEKLDQLVAESEEKSAHIPVELAPVEQETLFEQMSQVIDLYKQGFSKEHISKILQIGIGEVSLMINLSVKEE